MTAEAVNIQDRTGTELELWYQPRGQLSSWLLIYIAISILISGSYL